MKRFRRFHITYVLFIGLIASCNTYKTYYSPTISLVEENYEDIVRLNISTSKQSFTPLDIARLEKLRVLDLSSRTRDDLQLFLDHLPNPEEMQVLILDSLRLEELPESLSKFSKLKHISLNGNTKLRFEQVIDIIKVLPIKFLNLQGIGLEEIPKSINELTVLEDLNLSSNKLSAFDDYEHLSTLKNLKSLWLTNNGMMELPDSLGSLEQLRNLYIEHNRLERIPPSIIGMKKVWVIHAGHNLFTELPENLGKMPGLFLLHINNNRISSISDFYLDRQNYSFLGLILDNNQFPSKVEELFKAEFDHFFILSF